MPLAREKKQEVIAEYAVKDGDTGSPEVQIALLSEEIQSLTEHLRVHRERALALAPEHAEAHNNRGNVLYDLGRHAEALAHLQCRVVAVVPDFLQE